MSATRPPRFDSVAHSIQEALTQEVIPSLAVAAAQNGEILWEEGFGWADRERMIPATPHSMYSLASISKPVTATALMVLKERGLIDLDQPVNDYLDDAPLRGRAGDAAGATVRRVANHTSGLPLHFQFFYEDEPYRRPPMEETIRRYGNLTAAPGERFQYSNLGYGILDHLISRLSGTSYADFLRQEVFLPLGMTHSSVDIGPGLEEFEARRYGQDGIAYPPYDFDHPGGSAVYASAHDLVRFGMFHLRQGLSDQKKILSSEGIEAMQVPTAQREEVQGYGIGWVISPDTLGYRMVSHGGGMGGVSTTLYLIPSEGIVITVLCNSSKGGALPSRVSSDIAGELLPPFGERLKAQRAEQVSSGDEPAKAQFQPPPELPGDWSGTVHNYLTDLPFTLTFQESGDVHGKLGDDLVMLLNDVSFKDGWLTGVMAGDIGTPDAGRRRHNLRLDLRLRGDVLNGALIAVTSEPQTGGAPGKRVGNALASWIELRRA